MKNTIKLLAMTTVAVGAVTLQACVDDAYDLENINTEVEVKVNNLVVPINLDAITLSNAFDLEEGSVVKEINGEYAVLVEGDFISSQFNVAPVKIAVDGSIAPINCNIFSYSGSDVNLPVAAQTISYEITRATSPFKFESSSVDKSVRSLKKVKGNWNTVINMKLNDNNHLFNSLQFQKLVLEIPAGLHVTNYTTDNGKVYVNDLNMNLNGVTQVTLTIDEIDFTKFTAQQFSFVPANDNANNGVIKFNGEVGVQSGFVVGSTNSTSATLPQQVTLNISTVMNPINVESVTGEISYEIEGFNVDNVTLDDLPDLLKEPGTDVSLANPQLYISVNNPVANYGLKTQTGLTLTAVKGQEVVNKCSLNPGESIILGADKGVNGPYNFCLSPSKPTSFYGDYTNAEYVGYASFSKLLSGDGLPDYLTVDFDKPHIIPAIVNDFKLNQTIDPVEGSYTMYAPLELTVGSKIVYEEDETGWGDETVSKITVTRLSVSATATNSLPVDIVVSGTPLDVNGNPCVDPATGKVVKLEGLTVAAGTTAPIELHSTGTVKGIDGIRYTATCVATEAGKTLKPSATINLENIRVTVDGYYIDEL
ncbi:MAG: hypothetical protein NC082_05435 [Clostridiales bacterium]|nr:hypothetical protein [Clostridiales bacterium]